MANVPLELAVPAELFVDELAKRGISGPDPQVEQIAGLDLLIAR